MNNEPVAWIAYDEFGDFMLETTPEGDYPWQPLYTHPAKELHLSLQKSKETGELLAVTYTDDEHRIVEVLWQKPPAKTLTDEEIDIETTRALNDLNGSDYQLIDVAQLIAKYLMQAILRKAN